MRHRIFIAAFAVGVSAVVAAGAGADPASSASAATVTAPSSVSLPIAGYYQMAVDSTGNRVFISQGTSGGDSIVVTDFSGSVVGSIAEPSAVEGIALSPDGSTLYAALIGSATVTPAISVISTSSLAQTTTLPLPAGDTPRDVAVQSGDLWASYAANANEGGIGDFDLSETSPALQSPSVMSHWGAAPMLAADPAGTGNELVAVLPNALSPEVGTYKTSTATAEGGGYPFNCSKDEYDYAVDVAVVPRGAGLILACDAPASGDEYLYSTSDLSEETPVYGTVGTPNAIAIASSTGLVAVGGADMPQIADVYTPGGNQTNQYKAVGNGGALADRGLGLSADGTELFAVTSVESDGSPEYSLNVYPDPGITPTSVTLAANPANLTVGKTVTVTGTLLIGGAIPPNTTIAITRTGAGQPADTFTADVRFGEFTWIDYPPPGTYTYTANYPATATSAASSASVKVTVAKEMPSFSLSVTPTTASYGQAVKFDARFDSALPGSPGVSTVTVYAQTAGSSAKTKIASGLVGGISNVSGTAHFDKTTTLYAVYPGNSDNSAVTVTKTVNVGAKVTASIAGYYGTKSGYRLYHHTARLKLTAVVAPVKKGECVQVQVQKYVKKAWQAVVTTGCVTLNAKSEASVGLAVSKYAEGIPYRVRADYIRGKDTSNLDADSGFLDFMVKP
ncbi:MAG: hypothetical protein ABSA02_33520 [Trebonia sp.]|jgi:hypothetical protein